ncbi:MAG: excinuclease ABC subunit UvrC [Clostridia bacterium]|nr:excinuclease ABC subunit UvrC [Clostridia bacterium]
MFDFEDELKKLPDKPGVYIMRNSEDAVLYVGKAVVLKNRVRSYFRGSHSERISKMIEQIDHFEYIVTDSEYEALLLECSLIKKHKPKYNVLLKDDKNFPYIKLTVNEPFPRLLLARKADKDGSRYFGPYLGAETVYNVIDAVRRIFPTRLCRKKIPPEGGHDRVCLNFHIGLCTGPCGGKITREEYMENVGHIIALLSGKTESTEKYLKEKMLEASEKMEFELAATYRDRLKAVDSLKERQKIVKTSSGDCDIIAVAKNENDSCLQIFFFRNGKISGRDYFIFENSGELSDWEIISSFITQFYSDGRLVPGSILIECEPDEEDAALITEWLTKEREHKCTLVCPQKGEKKRLVEMVKNNAVITLENFELSGRQKANAKNMTPDALAEILHLEKTPERIEAYDISNLGDSEIDASMVVFTNGGPDRSQYRRFKMKTVESRNDVGSVKETISRRLAHLKEGDEEFGKKPDLMMIDGGRGQVNAAIEAVKEAGFDIPVCGMVKDDHHKTRGLYSAEGEYPLRDDREMWHFVSAIQNEAHRFAITYNRKLTEKRYRDSELDNIPGVGEAKRLLLYRSLGSLPAIKAATKEELAGVKGISESLAGRIYDALHAEDGKK